MHGLTSARAFKFGAALLIGLALGACAKNNADDALNGGIGAGAPGSYQDFASNVGDRVFFETDSTELTSTAQATLDKQATWLNQYGRYTFTIEGHADERGTREYNFALGARRAEVDQELSHRQGGRGLAHEDDQLWQGTAGRRLQRYFMLVAKPPRRHGAGRRAELLTRRPRRP